MKDSASPKSLKNLLKDPSEIEALIKNPSKYGLDFYKSLSATEKQYIAFAAAAGLIGYGLYLNKEK